MAPPMLNAPEAELKAKVGEVGRLSRGRFFDSVIGRRSLTPVGRRYWAARGRLSRLSARRRPRLLRHPVGEASPWSALSQFGCAR